MLLAPVLTDRDIVRIIVLLALILVAGFFTGSETAVSSCNVIRIRTLAEDGNRSARRLTKILDDFDYALVTLLICTNIIYTTASAVATVLCVSIWGTTIGSAVASVGLTLLVFLFCETIPKNIARTNCDRFALAFSAVIRFFIVILRPAAWIFTVIGNFAKRLFGNGGSSPTVTEDELVTTLDQVEETGYLEHDETAIVRSAIEFGDICARDVMTPRRDIVALDLEAGENAIKSLLIDSKFSRIPVYRRDIDRIFGVLQTSEGLFRVLNEHSLDLQELCVPPYEVHPDAKLNELFEEMSRLHTHLAIVKSDNGRTMGLVTMEDILSEIVGEMTDEEEQAQIGDAETGMEAAV